jgi:hypothetical protein
MSEQSEVVPFPPTDPLNQTGRAVLELVRQAASVAQHNTQHAVNAAHKLSMQLRAAEDRIRELEAAVGTYKQRAEDAETWMRRIGQEIEQRFTPGHSPEAQSGPASVQDYAPRRRRTE